jgi:hypothetical protein
MHYTPPLSPRIIPCYILFHAAGILPINQMRDYAVPADLIASRIPMHLLDAAYGMHIKRDLDMKDVSTRPPNASELLCAYCAVKGLITSSTGRWDEFRACKEMLGDFNEGRILFVAPPMAAGQVLTDETRWLAETERTMMRSERVAERIGLQKLREADALLREMQMGEGLAASEVAREAEEKAGSTVVYGGADFEYIEDEEALLAAGGAEEEDGEESAEKREHKRTKMWGKKNRKLRNKTPYGEENYAVSFTAYSTSRNITGPEEGKKGRKNRRHNTAEAFGTPYVRTTLPHYQNKTPGIVSVAHGDSSSSSGAAGVGEGGTA